MSNPFDSTETACADDEMHAPMVSQQRSESRSLYLLDQMASSISTLLVSVLVARSSTPAVFADVSIWMILYAVFLEGSRSRAGEVLLSKLPSVGDSVARTSIWRSGLAFGACSLVWGYFAHSVQSWWMLAIALCCPLVLQQDHARYVGFASRTSRPALTLDLVWLLLFLAVMVLVRPQGIEILYAWVICGALAGLCSVGVPTQWLRAQAASADDLAAWKSHGPAANAFFVEFVLRTAVFQGALLLLPRLMGSADFRSFRLAWLTVNPLNLAFLMALPYATPRITALLAAQDHRSAINLATRLSYVLSGLALAWCATLLVLPKSLASNLLGRPWSELRTAAATLTFGRALLGVRLGAVSFLRSGSRREDGLRLAKIASPVSAGAMLGGAIFFGLSGATAGLAAGEALVAVVAWRLALSRKQVAHRGAA